MRVRVILAIFLVFAAIRPAGADMVNPGFKFVDATIVLSSANLEPYTEGRHVIAKGDTLGAIAKAYYGDAARAAEIEKANPKIDPAKPEIGKALVLPAKSVPPKDAAQPLVFLFYVSSNFQATKFERVFFGVPFEAAKFGNRLWAVPAKANDEFQKVLAEFHGDWTKIDAIDGVLRSGAIQGEVTVPEASEAVKSKTFYEIGFQKKDGEGLGAERKKIEYTNAKGEAVKAGFGGPVLLALLLVAAAGMAALRKRRVA